MKDNTKIKVRLSKQLFESLTKQVIAEAKMKKNLGTGMTEVKAKKAKKEKVEEVKVDEMETKVAEDVNPMHYVNDPTLILLTQILGSGLLGTMATAVIKGIIDDVKGGKKSSKQAAKEAGEVIKKSS